jgi:valyl-tRNA synthetase
MKKFLFILVGLISFIGNSQIVVLNDPAITVQSSSVATTVPGSVIDNDILNGLAVTTVNTNVTPINLGPLSVDANGVITLAANIPSGTYTVSYELCEANIVSGLNVIPANCNTATATVIVANILDAVNDLAITVQSSSAATIVPGSVITNDTLNGLAVTTTNTNITPITTGPLSVNANGIITLAANTPSGTYTVTYQLCEADPVGGLNVVPSNCDTAIATVIVDNVISTVNDLPVTVASSTVATTVPGTVIANDLLNGLPVTISNTNVTAITTGPLSLNANGVITLAANTPAGTYSITYQLCEANPVGGLNVVPPNCNTATATVIVYNVAITVSTTAYTVPQLVTDVLFGSGIGGSTCAGALSNITWGSCGNGLGYFTNTNPNFPLNSGVVLVTGNVNDVPGPNDTTLSGGPCAGDNQLFNYIDGLGIDPGLFDYNDATRLEFDFVPLTNTMSFDFLFASEEYGTFQCTFSDAFAFFLTDVTAGTPFTNLALIPSTTTPISVITIRNTLFNGGCPSANPTYFDKFYQLPAPGLNPNLAPIDFNGHTIKMTASSAVIPNHTYHIKLVIADRNDSLLDSAVFLGGGSFNIGQASISGANGTGFESLTDFTIANGAAVCNQECREVKAGTTPIPGVTYQWTLNGTNIPGATNFNYSVCAPGTYGIDITFPSGCLQQDSMIVEYLPAMPISNPIDLFVPCNPFDLTINTPIILNGQSPTDYIVNYHHTLAEAQAVSNIIPNPTNYTGFNGEFIYASIQDDASGTDCRETRSFQLFLNAAGVPTFTQVAPICTGDPLAALPIVSNNGFTGTWSPLINNTTTTTYTFTPTVGQCATTTTMTITVNSSITPTFTQVPAICSGAILAVLPVVSNNGITGSWSPALNNTTTTTYTFTPTVGQCANTTTMTITVNPNILPLFTQIAPICSGDVLAALPVNSNNGITGVWSPAIDNTTTTTYTFTPTAGQCALPTTMTITVTPGNASIFTQVVPICAGSALSPLPILSNNGITGVWAPALNNTTTTTYTFTPTPGQCAGTATMTIVVNPPTVPTFTQVAPICSGLATVLPLVSTNGINGTWSPAINNTATTLYTFTPTAGQCATNATMTIVVNPLPTATIVSSTPSVCMNYPSPIVTLSGFTTVAPYTFVYTENGTSFTSPPSSPTYDINVPTTTVGPITYTLASVTDGNGCTQIINQSVTVTVLTAPIINTPLPYELCDDDSNDGVACFDLAGVVAPQVTSNPTLIVTFHETLTDSQTGSYPQANPYCNVNNLNNQIIYIRVFDPNAPQCYALTTVQLIVHPKPIAVEPTDLHQCDDDYDGFVSFDLTQKAAEILGGISLVTHTITYYESLADAQVPQNAIGVPTNYTNTAVNTQTIWVRVETTATGCFDIVELQLVVDPLPLVNQPACAAYTVCETTAPIGFELFNLQTRVDCILLNQLGMSVTFYPSLLNAQNNTNAITNLLYTNTQPYVQTLGIRVTNMATDCYVVSTMDIRVDPLPIPIAPLTAYEVCDTDQNGYYEFDLNTLTAGILGANPNGNVISYHYTQQNAIDGTYDINLTQPFYNTIAYMQTIWVRVENPLTGCYGVIPIQLKVNQSPRMPNLNDLTYCDEDSNNQNATTTVNLAQQTPLILAAQTVLPTSNYTVTYYTSLSDAQQQINNIINTTTFTGTNQTIWVVIEHNITGCTEIGQFDLIINIPLAISPPPALSLCDDDAQPNNTFTTFDLTVRDIIITTGLPGYTVTYYPTYANALAHTNAITNPTAYVNTQSAVQTLGVMVTSPDGCRSYTTMDIRVLPVPTPNTTNIPILTPQCEDAIGSGQQFFDLTVNQTYILNNDPNVTPHYFHTLADATAVPPVNEIINPVLAYVGDASLGTQVPRPVNQVQYIYIAVTSNLFTEYTGQNCYTIVSQPFIVNPLPIANAIGEQQICEEDPVSNNGIEVFNLTSYTSLILAGNNTTPASTYVVSFYQDAGLTIPITNPSAYTNLTNPQTIYVSVTTSNTYVDPVTGTSHTTSCTSLTNFDIRVNPKPTITQPAAPLNTCDVNDSNNDGYQIYSFDSLVTEILNGQDPTQFSVTFYESEYNPDATPPLTPTAIVTTSNYYAYTHTFWAAVTNNATGCFKTTSFNIVVEQTPEPFITNDPNLNVICVDYNSHIVVRTLLLESVNQTTYLNAPTTPEPLYNYQWYENGTLIPGATSASYLIDDPLDDTISSIFTLVMTSQNPLGCNDISQDYLVIQSGQATPIAGSIGYTVTNAFTDNQIITVTVEGYGTYQYSLDDGPRQDSPVFENVSLGEHIITVWDIEGGLENSCDPLIIEQVQTIDYPLYFTPNGDGIHDNWNIVGLAGQPAAKIYIFDRNGKLLKQLSSQSQGWDGTYNGQQLPSTDYWFTVDYTEQEALKQFKAHFSLKR